jgi:hypothetical protein
MYLRKLIESGLFSLLMLYVGALNGQVRVGDWEMKANAGNTALEGRFARTPEYLYSGEQPDAFLYLKRIESGRPVDLLVIATLDKEQNECGYESWRIAIDGTSINVKDSSLDSETFILRAAKPNTQEELWKLFKRGWMLAISVNLKCSGSLSNKHPRPEIKIYTFSLHGSSAAYNFATSQD